MAVGVGRVWSRRRRCWRYRRLRRAVTLQPSSLELQLNLAAAYADSGLVERATEMLEEAAAKHPRAASAHFNQGTLHARQQRYEDAAAALRQVL